MHYLFENGIDSDSIDGVNLDEEEILEVWISPNRNYCFEVTYLDSNTGKMVNSISAYKKRVPVGWC